MKGKILKSILALGMAASMLAGCSNKGGKDDGQYTYNAYVSSNAVQTLNVHEWEYGTENDVISLVNSGLYDIVYSADKPYAIQNEMAAAAPEDVTGEYAGTFGVPADAKEGYAFKVALREDAKWEDGTPINADTYVYSMQQMINPEMMNYRTSSFAEGQYELAGAYEYAYGEDHDGNPVETTWDSVGLIKNDDYSITIVLAKPVQSEFYFYYGFTGSWLVKEDLYEANKTEADGVIKSSYGTSMDKFASCGPYKLSAWQNDKIISLVKNENWYGWNDPAFAGQYQTTNVNWQIIDKHETAMMLFLQGNLDTIELDNNDLSQYGTSDYTLYAPNSYVYKVSFNTDYDALKSRSKDGVCKTIYTYKDFREAFALSIDRNAFVQAVVPNGMPTYGLLNECYVYDPDNGLTYRDSDQAKQAILNTYEASDLASLTGFNKARAAELYEAAYQAALAAGDISANDKVVIEFNVNTLSDTMQNTINFLNDAVKAATAGTSLEGRVSVEAKEVDDHYEAMLQGTCDLHFSNWGGSDFDPCALMDCYCVYNYYCDGEGGFDNTQTFTATIDGKEYTMSFEEWDGQLQNGTWATAPIESRLQVLAAIEENVLRCYNTTPLYSLNEATMLGQKVEYVTYDYSPFTGFGGLRFMTYNYNDVEWEAFCKEHNNQLTY